MALRSVLRGVAVAMPAQQDSGKLSAAMSVAKANLYLVRCSKAQNSKISIEQEPADVDRDT